MTDHNFKIFKNIEIRFGDIDALGHMNNARYLSYMEDARMHYSTLAFPDWNFQNGFADFPFVVGDAYCRYHSPAFLGETLRVATGVTLLGTKSFVMEFIFTEQKTNRLVATGKTTLIMFDLKTMQSYPVPEDLIKKVEEIEGKTIPKK